MNIIGIIQARTSSTRLPNKVFYNLSGKPLIWHVFQRLSTSKLLTKLVLATTTNSSDDSLEDWANKNEIDIFRGDENNVLKRYYDAAVKFSADIIVRITADDPFKESKIVDDVINLFLKSNLDFAFNNKPATFPEGLDVEVFSMRALTLAYENSTSLFEQEHVTQYFHLNPERFKTENLFNKDDLSHLRWTIDTIRDYEMTKEIYDHLYNEGSTFKFEEILDLLNKHPEISQINALVERSGMYK